MRKLIIFTWLSLMFATFSFSSTDTLIVSEDDQRIGFQEGESMAKEDVSAAGWIAIGCLTGGLSWLYPEVLDPAVPQSPLIGKSEAYAAGFIDGYNGKRKSIIQRNSCIGGGIAVGTCAAYYIVSLLLVPSWYFL